MSTQPGADTIRVLVATDNHVGAHERDSRRSDDAWKSFHEIMCLARERDVDFVLLGGDTFHDNKPSRKSLYQVMRSMRMNCYGDKPCELEMLSDASENFEGAFNYANYEDENINVAIPIFAIAGNHDDLGGESQLAALDLLQVSGLVNFFGKVVESDKIPVKPVLLQKGRTKLALYGISNVRDERLFRTFRDGGVKFYRPNQQKENWFNLLTVHQNHHKYSETNYLPENVLPDFMDLVVWGHEHECLIDPRFNPEMNFHVMQPGSSVATSLVPGEAVEKHVAVLEITGKEFQSEAVPLKTVRPFVMKEIILQDQPGMKKIAKKNDNRADVTEHLIKTVEKMIEEANQGWLQKQEADDEGNLPKPPLPLIRLRVEHSAPDGGKFDIENPQRFSGRFSETVANITDVVQFHRKKTATRKLKDGTELPEESLLAQLAMDNVKIEKLVREYLSSQSLKFYPQDQFGEAIDLYVSRDDNHAISTFLTENTDSMVKETYRRAKEQGFVEDNIDIHAIFDDIRTRREEAFAAGRLKNKKKGKLKPRPSHWDSDLDGSWSDQPAAVEFSDDEGDNQNRPQDQGSDVETRAQTSAPAPTRGRGRGRGATARASTTAASSARGTANKATTSKATTARGGRKKDKEDDVIMIDDDDDKPEDTLPARVSKTSTRSQPNRGGASTTTRTQPSRQADARQSRLNFSQTSTQTRGNTAQKQAEELSDDIISDSDGDDAFEPAPPRRR